MQVRVLPSQPFRDIAQWQSSRLITGRSWFDSACLYISAAPPAVPLTAACGRLLHIRNAMRFEAPWSNGYDFPLSSGRSGFNSPWGRQLRAYRLTARTSGSQPDGRGSNPRTLTIRGGRRKGVRHRCAKPDPFPARRPGNRTRLSESRNAGLIPAEPTKLRGVVQRPGRLPREQENVGSSPTSATLRFV